MTTELWQAVRTSDIEHVKELMQHMKQLHNDPLSVAVAPVTPRNVSDPQLNVEERGMSTSQSTVPAISDSMSSITKSPRSDDSIGSPPSTPKSPESGQSSSRGRLLATNEFWCEVLNAVDDQGFTSLTWAVLLAKEELIVVSQVNNIIVANIRRAKILLFSTLIHKFRIFMRRNNILISHCSAVARTRRRSKCCRSARSHSAALGRGQTRHQFAARVIKGNCETFKT